jgi:hypothetical protein
MKNTFKKRNIAVRIFVSVVMVCSIFMGVGLPKDANASCDLMILDGYDCDNIDGIGQDVFTVNITPQPIQSVENLEEYNE